MFRNTYKTTKRRNVEHRNPHFLRREDLKSRKKKLSLCKEKKIWKYKFYIKKTKLPFLDVTLTCNMTGLLSAKY